jgi:hypothetical protein
VETIQLTHFFGISNPIVEGGILRKPSIGYEDMRSKPFTERHILNYRVGSEVAGLAALDTIKEITNEYGSSIPMKNHRNDILFMI